MQLPFTVVLESPPPAILRRLGRAWWACVVALGPASYECEAEGFVAEALDRTSQFARFLLRPRTTVRGTTVARVRQAPKVAQRYGLVAQSLKGETVVEPEIVVLADEARSTWRGTP